MGAPDINWNTSRPPDVKYQPRKLRHAQRAANLFQRNYSISTRSSSVHDDHGGRGVRTGVENEELLQMCTWCIVPRLLR